MDEAAPRQPGTGRAVGTRAYPPAGRAWYVVGLLTIAYIFSFVDKYIPALLVEPIKQDLRITDTQMGLLLGPAFALLYAALGLPFGWLADRTRRASLVAAGVALWSLATAMSGLARNFSHLLLARFGVGIGDATLVPCALSMISDSFPPERRGRPIALYIAAQSFGAGVALLGGAAVLAWAAARSTIDLPVIGCVKPWQFTFIAVGLPGLLIALLLLFVREPIRESTTTSAPGIRATLNELRAHAGAFGSLTAIVCVMTIVAYSQNWFAALYSRQWGWDIAKFATWTGLAMIVIGPLIVNLTGWMSDRLVARGVRDAPLSIVLAGTAVLVPTGVAAPLMPTGELAFAVWIGNLVGLALVSAAAPVALLNITPGAMRGQVSALFYMVIMAAGLGLGPLAVGVFNDQFFNGDRLDYACALVPACGILPALLLGRYTRHRYRELLACA